MLHIFAVFTIRVPTCPKINVMTPRGIHLWAAVTFRRSAFRAQSVFVISVTLTVNLSYSSWHTAGWSLQRKHRVFWWTRNWIFTMYINYNLEVLIIPALLDLLVTIYTTRRKRNSTCCPQTVLLLFYASQNNQSFLLCKELTDWPLWSTMSTFTARHELKM